MELVNGRVGTTINWFWIASLGGGGGKANTPTCGIGNGAYLREILGNGVTKDFAYNFLDDPNVCSKVFAI